ncbi:hypothetical protein E4U13_005894 [Claviceps humidiphila]|uniref:Uncharacterized protein n=1 Tax=Claviceps humidiphila TaxID=1294629 RepID=A0A9P7PX32_9HYPO|nr:hypothetical protein E4U13_005894 [Claviceps humidiphila]
MFLATAQEAHRRELGSRLEDVEAAVSEIQKSLKRTFEECRASSTVAAAERWRYIKAVSGSKRQASYAPGPDNGSSCYSCGSWIGLSRSTSRSEVVFLERDAMIDPYFATINSKFPIWDKSKSQAMMDSIRNSCHRVPRHYLHMLEQLFTHTARCAEATGILQWRRIRGRLRESGFQEYNELAHRLYILDKKGCWTAGVPPRIPAEVQLNLAAQYTDKVLEALAL